MSSSPWSPEQLDALNRLTTVARLLSTAVHDTGNSLQIISGNAELLEARPDDPDKTRSRARTIKSHADHSAARLQRLVALGRPEASPPVRLLLRVVTESAVDLRRYSLNRQHIGVSIDEVTTNVAIRAEETLVVRLIANLVLNAEQAVAGRSGAAMTLTIGVEGRVATLSVADNGEALPADSLDRLFESFAHPRDPWSGLAAARALAIGLGGTLDVDRAFSGGTRIVLALPIVS